jgi:phosphoglycolate phosphatase
MNGPKRDVEGWRPAAVLFDFDGTLADSYPAITASVNHVRQLHALPPLNETEVRHHVGRGPEYLLQQTVPGADPARALASYRGHHPEVMRQGTRLFPGVAEVVSGLTQAGIRLAVCSNKPRPFTCELLDHLGIADRFTVVLGPQDVHLPKPAPDMLLAALQRLGITAEQALYVGDMVIDITCARAAGVRVAVVPTGSDEPGSLAASSPDFMLEDLRELPGRLGTNRPS